MGTSEKTPPGAKRLVLDQDIAHAECRKVDRWTARYRLVTTQWSMTPVDPVFNAHRPLMWRRPRRSCSWRSAQAGRRLALKQNGCARAS